MTDSVAGAVAGIEKLWADHLSRRRMTPEQRVVFDLTPAREELSRSRVRILVIAGRARGKTWLACALAASFLAHGCRVCLATGRPWHALDRLRGELGLIGDPALVEESQRCNRLLLLSGEEAGRQQGVHCDVAIHDDAGRETPSPWRQRLLIRLSGDPRRAPQPAAGTPDYQVSGFCVYREIL